MVMDRAYDVNCSRLQSTRTAPGVPRRLEEGPDRDSRVKFGGNLQIHYFGCLTAGAETLPRLSSIVVATILGEHGLLSYW